VEEGWLKDPVTETVARRYLAELLQQDIDTLILGCTHYPLIRSLVGRVAGENVQLVNPAYETAKELEQLLRERNLLNTRERGNESEPYRFYVSDAADKFKRFANSILPYDIETTIKINIEEY
jgi:glutamate racemase